MPWFTIRYSGMALYFSKAAFQPASLSGGTTPINGCHSVMESPESVSRVAPPISTIAKISPATDHSQRRISG